MAHGGLFAFVSLVVGGSCENSSPSVPPSRLQAVHPECRARFLGASRGPEGGRELREGTGLPLPPVLSSKGHCEVNLGLHGRGGRGRWSRVLARHLLQTHRLPVRPQSPSVYCKTLVPMEEEAAQATIRRWDGEALLHRLSF